MERTLRSSVLGRLLANENVAAFPHDGLQRDCAGSLRRAALRFAPRRCHTQYISCELGVSAESNVTEYLPFCVGADNVSWDALRKS